MLCRACALALFLHRLAETGLVDAQAHLSRGIATQLQRKAIGVVKPENLTSGYGRLAALRQLGRDLGQSRQPLIEGRQKTLLLAGDRLTDKVSALLKLNVVVPHCIDHHASGLPRKGCLKPRNQPKRAARLSTMRAT